MGKWREGARRHCVWDEDGRIDIVVTEDSMKTRISVRRGGTKGDEDGRRGYFLILSVSPKLDEARLDVSFEQNRGGNSSFSIFPDILDAIRVHVVDVATDWHC